MLFINKRDSNTVAPPVNLNPPLAPPQIGRGRGREREGVPPGEADLKGLRVGLLWSAPVAQKKEKRFLEFVRRCCASHRGHSSICTLDSLGIWGILRSVFRLKCTLSSTKYFSSTILYFLTHFLVRGVTHITHGFRGNAMTVRGTCLASPVSLNFK